MRERRESGSRRCIRTRAAGLGSCVGSLPCLRTEPAHSGLIHPPQSPVEIDRVVIGFGGVVSVVVCTAVVLLFLLPRPAAVASAFAFQAQYMSVLLRALGVQRPADPDKTGRAISLLWSGVLLGAHVAEARFCTLPLFKTYSVRRRSVRVTYVRPGGRVPSRPLCQVCLLLTLTWLTPLVVWFLARAMIGRPRKLVLTVLGGFPIWQALRDKGQEEEEKLSKAQ